MKRTLLVGASMFAMISGVSAQVDVQEFDAYKADWKKSHKVVEMTPAQYEQMKTAYVESRSTEPVRVTEEISVAEKIELKNAAKRQEKGLPANFPIKNNTGNAEADEDAYQLEKALWIENNKVLYDQMMTKSTPPTKEQLEERRQVLNNQIK